MNRQSINQVSFKRKVVLPLEKYQEANLEILRQIIRECVEPQMLAILIEIFEDETLRTGIAKVRAHRMSCARAPSAHHILNAARSAKMTHCGNASDAQVLYCACVLQGVMRFWMYTLGLGAFNAQEELRAMLKAFAKKIHLNESPVLAKLRLALGMGTDEEQNTPQGLHLRQAVYTSWAWASMGVVVE